MLENRKKDRRVQRTEALLIGALGDLIREKSYEDIVVKEILGRANVGRSTFYTHFADKGELLRSHIHDILRPARQGDLVWFSLPILEHVERHRHTGHAALTPRGRREVHDHLQLVIGDLIEDDVRAALRRGSRTAQQPPPDLLVRWIASTFVLVLDWWVESDSPLPAREVDGLVRALIEPSLAHSVVIRESRAGGRGGNSVGAR